MTWRDMFPEEIEQKMKEMNQPSFRAKQIFSWIQKGVSLDEMKNVPKTLRQEMKRIPLGNVKIIEKYTSKLDGTTKYLFLLDDDHIIEGVYMRYKHGNTLCVSTQVGCRMGCTFCASTIDGLVRNLSAGEILGQIMAIECEQREAGNVASGMRAVTNVVLMGSGEPLDNYDEVVRFLKLVNDKNGMNISLRNISVSTCGLSDRLGQLAQDAPGITLCISLHAPDDALRQEMMPVAKRFPLDELLQAVRDYVAKTSRRVIFEYAMVRGVNDSDAHARRLAERLRGFQCHVNLIPLNEVKENNLKASTLPRAREFCNLLEKQGISATIRRELGDDIDGACGQLRRRYLTEKSVKERSFCNLDKEQM